MRLEPDAIQVLEIVFSGIDSARDSGYDIFSVAANGSIPIKPPYLGILYGSPFNLNWIPEDMADPDQNYYSMELGALSEVMFSNISRIWSWLDEIYQWANRLYRYLLQTLPNDSVDTLEVVRHLPQYQEN